MTALFAARLAGGSVAPRERSASRVASIIQQTTGPTLLEDIAAGAYDLPH